ncbi:MAG TPA: acetolactate synthase small subunit [Ktedonobacteraceae bacterium]|nr:acetolactate synthase small subunit [Ktedonobacteraceae bacterium]
MTEITNQQAAIDRTGHSDAPQGAEHIHALIILVEERPGAVDRVVGVLRRRRANMQALTLGQSGLSDSSVASISVLMSDSEVGIDHLVEQLRKIVDVQHVVDLPYQPSVGGELAMNKVISTVENANEIIDMLFGTRVLEITPETITLAFSTLKRVEHSQLLPPSSE